MDALTAARSRRAQRLQIAILAAGLAGAVVSACVLIFHLAPECDRLQAAWRASYVAHQAMLDQETGLRGYVATRDPAYLEPAARGAAELKEANARLETLIGSDPALAPLLLQTRLAEQRWIERWAEAARQPDATRDAAFLADGKAQFDAYRERQLALSGAVEARTWANDVKRRAVRLFVLGLLLGLLASLVLLAARERRARDSYERRLHVLIRGAHAIAESLDEPHIVRVVEQTAGQLMRGADARVVPASAGASAPEIATRAIDSGKAVHVQADRGRASGVESSAVPMTVGGRVVGALVATAMPAGRALEPHAVELFRALADHAAAAIESARLYRIAEEQSRVDALTHVFNRRRFDEDLGDECRRSARYGRPLSLLMIDVDHFKAYNDSNGHSAGDKALQEVAALLRAGVRLIDSVYRFGGEELVILLRETDVHGAKVVAERLRATVQAAGRVTASFGVAELDPKHPVPGVLIEAADRALYSAKRSGRNRVALATTRPEEMRLDA